MATAQSVVPAHGGLVFKLVGDGGWAAFESASGAVEAARALQVEASEGTLPARVAMYSGESEPQPDGDWLGVPLNRCARLLSLGHPGQVLVAGSTALLMGVDRRVLRELGLHHLRDVDEPIVVYQLFGDGLPAEFPPLRSDVQHVSLPVPRGRLIGRVEELGHVGRLVEDHRLVTLTGVGGTGKTRLAVASAWSIADRFELTAFVDLSALTQPGQIVPAALDAAGAMMGDQTPAADVLAGVVGVRRVLLVVDNAEHLLDGVGDLCDTLLDRCPHVRLLVTSREPLGVVGEQVWRVPSLDARGAAIELFREHAGVDVAESIAVEVCERLDGIPLAIELAGARARSLGADEVLANLSDRFRVLIGGRRARGRQATMHAALDWSHHLLDEPERMLLRRLAVFAGGFTIDAAKTVCAPLDGRSIRDALSALVDKSLVVWDGGTHRHGLLETVRAFALDRLVDAGEAERCRDAHADWMVATLADQPFNDPTTLLPLLPEAANLRAAMDWLADCQRDVELIRLADLSGGIWYQLLLEPELAPQLNAAFERCRHRLDLCDQVKAINVIGALSSDRRNALVEALQLDPDGRCEASLGVRAYVVLYHSLTDGAAALTALDELRRSWPPPRSPDFDLLLRVAEAQARWREGDRRGAEAVYMELLDDHPSIYVFGPLASLVTMRITFGDFDGAERVLARVESDPHRHGRIGMLACETRRCELLTAQGDLPAAAAMLRAVEAIRDRRLAFYPAADQHWLEAAAFLATALEHIADAAVLATMAERLLGPETSPFITWSLHEDNAQHPAWQAARRTPPTIERARATARTIGRLL